MQHTWPTTDALLSRAEIGHAASVSRPAMTKWVRHPTFPQPIITDGGEFYRWHEVRGWLAGRAVPATARTALEPPGMTYAERADRNLASARHHSRLPSPAPDPGADPQPRLAELTGSLAARLGGPGSDYLDLLASLVFLQVCAPARWQSIRSSTPPNRSTDEANKLLVRMADTPMTHCVNLGRCLVLPDRSHDCVQSLIRI